MYAVIGLHLRESHWRKPKRAIDQLAKKLTSDDVHTTLIPTVRVRYIPARIEDTLVVL